MSATGERFTTKLIRKPEIEREGEKSSEEAAELRTQERQRLQWERRLSMGAALLVNASCVVQEALFVLGGYGERSCWRSRKEKLGAERLIRGEREKGGRRARGQSMKDVPI